MAVSAALAAGDIISSLGYTGSLRTGHAFWLGVAGAVVGGATYASAHVRDQVVTAHQQRDQAVLARLEDLEVAIGEYGDRREAAGQLTATLATRQIRRLSPID